MKHIILALCTSLLLAGCAANSIGPTVGMTLHSVILVYSTSHALRAEKLLKQAKIDCRLIPVPRHLSSDCGVCVQIERMKKDLARQVLETGGLEYEGIYDVGQHDA